MIELEETPDELLTESDYEEMEYLAELAIEAM